MRLIDTVALHIEQAREAAAQRPDARLGDPERRGLLPAFRRVEAEPALLGGSAHRLAVGRVS